tara:strand:+ start:745 stop:966 length:222 start_codon:yes stop_codon:yes gene_type:complete
MDNDIKMRRHHYGWLVTFPSEFVNWDYRTYREKYFESCSGDESAYRKAQRFVRETKQQIKEAAALEIEKDYQN